MEKEEGGTERMKGWVDVMPNTHIYLLPGQGVCCVIAPQLDQAERKKLYERTGLTAAMYNNTMLYGIDNMFVMCFWGADIFAIIETIFSHSVIVLWGGQCFTVTVEIQGCIFSIY